MCLIGFGLGGCSFVVCFSVLSYEYGFTNTVCLRLVVCLFLLMHMFRYVMLLICLFVVYISFVVAFLDCLNHFALVWFRSVCVVGLVLV